MPSLPSVPADWNPQQTSNVTGFLSGFPLSIKIESAGQHFQVFSTRKQSQRTYSEQERHEEANAVKADDEAELSEDEEEPDYLAHLDPKEWKSQDHYEVMGLTRYRYKATEDQIKNAFRKKVLKHHPDKKAQSGGSVNDDDLFKCIQKAFELLMDPEKKMHFDSVDPTFNDHVPSEKEITDANYFKVLGPIFEQNARFSKKQPVPKLGDLNTSQTENQKFYDFWYNIDSWRVFNYLDEEDVTGDNRGDKRHMEKKNLKARADRKKEDNARVRQLTDLALKLDPRIKKYKEAELQKKETALKNKELAKANEEAKAKKVQEAAKQAQQKAEEEAKAKIEKEKKDKDAKKNDLRKFRKNIRQEVKDRNYYLPASFGSDSKEVIDAMVQLEKVCESSTTDDLSVLSDASQKGPREFEELYRGQLRKFYDEKALPPPFEHAPVAEAAKEREWVEAEHSLLIHAVNLFPGGTVGRWDKIAAHFNEHSKLPPRSSKELTQEATKIKNAKEAVKVDTNKVVKKHNDTIINDQPTQRFEEAPAAKETEKGKEKEKAPEAAAAPAAAAAAADDEAEGKPWTKEEQAALEAALKNFPADAEGRWEKVAAAVGTRTKKQCMVRCKKLAQQIKDKKGGK